MDFDVLAFIGRFQPFHNGHKAVVSEALRRSKKVAIVLGSHDQPRTTRNPFTTPERIQMISAEFPNEVASGRIQFVPVIDHTYNLQRWIASVQTGVTMVANTPFTPDPTRIGLIGHAKDQSSFYLKCFPTWDSINVDNVGGIDATRIREGFFGNGLTSTEWSIVPDAVADWLDEFRKTTSYQTIRGEHEFILKYKQQWAASPYPPTFHTVDVVVVQSGHVLLIERGEMPGKGLWALPGGFLNQNETLRQGAIRELREETKIALSDETLDRCIFMQKTFDDPNRSQRGRTITTAFRIDLRPEVKLTKVKGADDAAKARWVPLSKVARSVMFDDHYDIITDMVSV
jgi:bifunctional NMN adenylyltransferase/nudix hydrolase